MVENDESKERSTEEMGILTISVFSAVDGT